MLFIAVLAVIVHN